MSRTSDDAEITALRRRLQDLETERAAVEARLLALSPASPSASKPNVPSTVDGSSPKEKIALFRRLFAGRSDVFALRWENAKDGRSGYAPACSNEWVSGVCGKPKIKCGTCPNQAFVPVTPTVIERHLRAPMTSNARSDFVVGVYPLLPDDTCWFLAADFDGPLWRQDALAFVETCRACDVPAALERSRSGNGGHVWIFFSEPIAAREARALGAALMTRTMERRPEIGFKSYDRFFPNQDTMPAGGFGNLIALPLARRSRQQGNSVFVDDDLRPFDDQWAYLTSLERMTPTAVSTFVRDAEERGRVLGVRMPLGDDESEEPWLLPPSRRRTLEPIRGTLPKSVKLVLANGVYIEREGLPPEMVTRLIRLAAFQNPEFYRNQAMRLPTYDKPRIVSCAELNQRHVILPRGCLDEAVALLRSNGVGTSIEDGRESGRRLGLRFLGDLQPEQHRAFDDIIGHDFGVLAAATAFGKTVVAAAAIARRGCSTLILVHRRELVAQWVARLKTFLSIDPSGVGTISGGHRKPTGLIDVAVIQSLVRDGVVSDLIAGYGHLIVDECHHLSAVTFGEVAARSKARYVLGLSATVTRKDGHHPIIFMQCGPIRHRVDARTQAARRNFEHIVLERTTAVRLAPELLAPGTSIASIYSALIKDEARHTMIVDDFLASLEAGRNPLVLTERREHLDHLASEFKGAARNIVVLRGGMRAGERRAALASLNAGDGEERLVLATGKYLGEGFDDARLDTLFLTLPVSWKGTLEQYVGRLHRDHKGKREVIVYDYVDAGVPMLARMASKRRAGYRSLGYRLKTEAGSPSVSGRTDSEETGQSARDYRLADSSDDRRPSEVFDRYWLYAKRKVGDAYPDHTERGGKWMIFVKNAEIDGWWATIKAATESGLLGVEAKVSTMKPNPHATSPDTRVICVYTYDVADEADCTRVRQSLRNLGVTWKIPYKIDADPLARRYVGRSGSRVSKRYE